MRPWACGFKMIIGWFGFAFEKQGHITAFRILFPLEGASCGGACWPRTAMEFPAWLMHNQVLFGGVI